MRRQKFSISQVLAVIQQTRGMIALAAERLGCSRTTLYRYVQRHAVLAQAVEDAREHMLDTAEDALYKQIMDGNTAAIIFFLKCQGKSRGYVEKPSGPVDHPTPAPALEHSEEWSSMKRSLLTALQQFPEAYTAVCEALRGGQASSNGHANGNGHGAH
jgi:AcrR family transcriptional regulator